MANSIIFWHLLVQFIQNFFIAFPSFQPVEVNDMHIVDIAEFLTEKPQIRKLGVTLGLKAREVDSILENNKDNINEAAYKVLQKWFQGQSNRAVAYVNLTEAMIALNDRERCIP